ncbi:hypothetical protein CAUPRSCDRAFT_11044 [Caulochytrium protostelioides]|uniref:t-SNARE coiled-coil homology domain-containing protein n=1 Tax=Caulochytrium protostelioides TaxID=1555241 RepID=A0A4P9WXN5_9FUNG|nr:hypothetical protein CAUPRSCDRAFT_11044 [Caulochytrium protostelioides]
MAAAPHLAEATTALIDLRRLLSRLEAQVAATSMASAGSEKQSAIARLKVVSHVHRLRSLADLVLLTPPSPSGKDPASPSGGEESLLDADTRTILISRVAYIERVVASFTTTASLHPGGSSGGGANGDQSSTDPLRRLREVPRPLPRSDVGFAVESAAVRAAREELLGSSLTMVAQPRADEREVNIKSDESTWMAHSAGNELVSSLGAVGSAAQGTGDSQPESSSTQPDLQRGNSTTLNQAFRQDKEELLGLRRRPGKDGDSPPPDVDAFLKSERALQDELTSDLASLAGTLKANAEMFQSSLRKDAAVLADADSLLDQVVSRVTRERMRLGLLRVQTRKTCLWVWGSIFFVAMMFVFTFAFIRVIPARR